jgi:hypothetical protein
MKSLVSARANNKSKHLSYFEHLESKLLEETDKLTNLIDQSHMNEHHHRTLKSNLSTGTLPLTQQDSTNLPPLARNFDCLLKTS